MKQTISPIQIPWAKDANLSKAYYETVRILAPHFEWIPFMDHDVEMMSRDWYAQLEQGIEIYPNAGLFACKVNLQHEGQRTQSLKIRDDYNAAYRLLELEKIQSHVPPITRIGASPPELISGCWFVVHAQRFLDLEPPPSGFYGVDNWIHRSLHNAGYPAYILERVLVWHRYTHLESRGKRENMARVAIPPLAR